MSKISTTGKRVLKGDTWHDDNGPIPDYPPDWDPPMTAAERHEAALSDPDNPPMTQQRLDRLRPVSIAKRLRWRLKLSQQDFADRYGIPVGTLRDWEQHRSQPDAPARALLKLIDADPEAAARILSVA